MKFILRDEFGHYFGRIEVSSEGVPKAIKCTMLDEATMFQILIIGGKPVITPELPPGNWYLTPLTVQEMH